MHHTPRLLLAATVLLAGAGIGCSDDDGDPLADTDSIDSEAPGGGSGGAGSGSDGSDGSDGDDPADDAPDEVVGSAEGQLAADPGDQTMVPLRLDVLAVERQGDLVELRFEIANIGEGDTPNFEIWSHFTDERQGYDLAGVAVVDPGAQKLYLPVLDSEGVCLCSTNLADFAVAPGESVKLNATFGGIPDDVEALDVRVPSFPAVEAVPVS
jgi:hypothetical protein